MENHTNAFERAMRLAAVTGLRAALGPALVAAEEDLPLSKSLATAALGEMVLDKVPFMPSRSSLPLLIPRAIAGYWVAKKTMEREGVDDPLAAPLGAAVAAGVALVAPIARRAMGRVLGVPDMVVGVAEDYLALKVGSEAVGMSMDEVKLLGTEVVGSVTEQLGPAFEAGRDRLVRTG